ncbi:BadF/BadG/BcrA/BcrD ATPase family protein [Kosmotoga pacifica]|uniref:ATPase BadF/BadG/BcrA/BcrD type domain-containing protein n=1 Tax=Kosmotoga pacifica TaxID=1330330 RepID=A0A0G2ZCV0_9BACT|nr:BadF/BadG/BcrA/BcrD ATPase family protein [Kosmotoga pacifica]AKI97389.1 hypothetical protein IX53_05660 [Kosmotoga pacifica]
MKVMGIDGGGTLLSASIFDGSSFEKETFDFSSNLSVVQYENLVELLENLKSHLGVPDALVASFSGAGDPVRKATLERALNDVFPNSYREIITDVEGVYRSCFPEGYGVVVIAGTGSVVYGKNSEGEPSRAGGWGHLFDDEGSAFWISKELIRYALKHRDGLIPPDPIFQKMLDHFNLNSLESLANLQLSGDFKAKIASFTEIALKDPSPLVFTIIKEASELLSEMISVVLKKTGSSRIILSGGCFKSPLYSRKIIEKFPDSDVEIFNDRTDLYIARELFQRLKR